MSEAPVVRFELAGVVAVLTMDDGKANALSHAMMSQLHLALSRAQAEAKAVVLVGRPERFSAGFDLKVMMSGPSHARALVGAGGELLMRMFELPMPLVAACTGHAVAGGALMLLSCDTRFGTAGEFRIGLNEVSIGMTVPILAQELARARLATPRLTEAVVQSRMYDPAEAAEVGFLDRVVAAQHLVAAATAHAETLVKLPIKAYAATKARVRAATIEHIRATLAADLDALTTMG